MEENNNEIETLQSKLKELKRLLNIEVSVKQGLEERIKILEQEIEKRDYCNDKLADIMHGLIKL
jgi:uncharacterized protein YlbG (UPF0298 family)